MFYNVDSEGFLINPTSIDNVSEHWKSVIDEVITLSCSVHGDNLHSLYLRGSVPEGTAHDYSDLDIICVLSERKETNLTDDHKQLIDDMISKKVDYSLIALDDFTEETEFLLKVQSLYIFGKDLILDMRKFSISDVPEINLKEIDDAFYEMCSYALSNSNRTDDDNKDICRWLSRRVLMSAYNIVISREGVYTRDLTSCFPASIARKHFNFDEVALLDCQQMFVPNDIKYCIRLLALVYLESTKHPVHPYLNESAKLRPDR